MLLAWHSKQRTALCELLVAVLRPTKFRLRGCALRPAGASRDRLKETVRRVALRPAAAAASSRSRGARDLKQASLLAHGFLLGIILPCDCAAISEELQLRQWLRVHAGCRPSSRPYRRGG